MKQTYSEYVYCKLARLMASGKINRSREEIAKRLLDGTPNSNAEDLALSLELTASEILFLDGKGTHLFCKKELFDWLISHAKDIEINKAWVENLFLPGEVRKSYIPILLHVSGGNSPSCMFMKSEDSQIMVATDSSGKGAIYYVADKISDFDATIVNAGCDQSKIIACSMFIKGLSIYMNCCKGVLRDGVPDDLKHAPRFNNKNSKHLRIHDDIAGGTSISPHFRNGHFRLLLSDRFTKKKGQIVFVHECFVKGHAVTVEGVE